MKSAKNTLIAMGAVFLACGLAFLCVSLCLLESMQTLKETGISAQGVFVSADRSNTRIRYEAEGEMYEIYSATYSSDMRAGDEVTVWYTPDDPGNGRMEHWAIWGVWLIMGGVFSLIGGMFLTVMLIGRMGRRTLMANGTPVIAQVTGIELVRWVNINRRHPYVIHAVCTHPYTGQEMKVKSEYLMEDPTPHIKDGTVEVLVDPMRDKRYYVVVGNR